MTDSQIKDELRTRFTEFCEFVEKITRDIEATCGCPVYSEFWPGSNIFNLYKNKGSLKMVFSYISQRVTLGRFNISTWEEHAKDAGVAHLANKRSPKGMFGKPALVWYVKYNDTDSYKKAVNVLSKICQVR